MSTEEEFHCARANTRRLTLRPREGKERAHRKSLESTHPDWPKRVVTQRRYIKRRIEYIIKLYMKHLVPKLDNSTLFIFNHVFIVIMFLVIMA